MSRDGGATRADWDTSYMDDAKVKALWRILEPDVATMCECLVVHEATTLATWREGRRVTVEDALPLWFPSPVAPRILDLLETVKLLDSAHRIPMKAWRGWIEPALDRIAAASEAGRKAGLASGEARRLRSTGVERPFNGNAKSLNPAIQPSSRPAKRARRGSTAGGVEPVSLGDLLPREIGALKAAVAAKGYDPEGKAS